MWVVGKTELVSARWVKNGQLVSTGSATALFIRNNSGTIEYLQSDLSTWSTTKATHSLTFNSDIGWLMTLTVPASADGFNVQVLKEHSDADFPNLTEEHYVTKKDSDDVFEQAGGSVNPVLDFG